MNKFTYLLPSGKRFTVTAPDGTTQLQADRIFYSQVAAGTLVGFAAGQSIGSVQSAAVKFALSRLDRGTAGIDDRVILSIVNGLPSISGIPNLVAVPLSNPINQADLANINFNNTYTPPAIGPLNSSQVQGLLAQLANFVDQPATEMSNDKGVGLYGLNCQQLEQAGYVKPGTYRQFIFDPSPLTDVVSAPGIWTGKDGIYNSTDFLGNPGSQSTAMTTLMQQSYNSLTATGTIVPPVTPSISALSGQVYTQSGLQTVSQLSAATGISLNAPTTLLPALANTPISNFLSTATTDASSLASGALNSATSGSLTNLTSVTSSLNNTVTGGVSALVTNASKFGTSAVNQWVAGAGLPQIPGINAVGTTVTSSLGLATDLTNNIQNLNVLGKASEFASGFSNPFTGLDNLGNFNLSSLTSGIPDVAQIRNLTGELTSSLTNGLSTSLNSITGSITDSLGGLTTNLAGNFGSLTDSLGSLDLSSFANLGDFSNLANLADLGSLTDLGGLFGGGGDSLVSATQVAAGYTNTVNRSVVDTAFTKILGNSKIPLPAFELPGKNSSSQSASADISYAQNQIQALGTQIG